MRMGADELGAALSEVFREASGADRVTVSDVRTMTGGAAREAWRMDAALERAGRPDEHQALVVLLFRNLGTGGNSPDREFELLRAAGGAGAPVPTPMYCGTVLDRPFYAMTRIEGETIGRRLVRNDEFEAARRRLPGQLAQAIAAVHGVSTEAAGLDFLAGPPAGKSPAVYEVERLDEMYRNTTVEPHPVFELALRWLAQHAPTGGRVGLVHGDFRIGNVMVHPDDGLRALLDWELAHLGDPLQDLGWMCVRSWRFGRDDLTCGGVGHREDFFRAYEAATGEAVDRETLRFWEVFGNLNWGVITLLQARAFLDGHVPSVEQASIGRRTAETEWELLNLIEGRAF